MYTIDLGNTFLFILFCTTVFFFFKWIFIKTEYQNPKEYEATISSLEWEIKELKKQNNSLDQLIEVCLASPEVQQAFALKNFNSDCSFEIQGLDFLGCSVRSKNNIEQLKAMEKDKKLAPRWDLLLWLIDEGTSTLLKRSTIQPHETKPNPKEG
jgi:hypothetical protein